jgi:sec-independent protein translocase protein TatB
MFDIGFSELVIIAIVALIVIGPERLPKVARTMGHLFGRLQRYVNDVKADISREMELDELKKLQASVQDAARSIEQTVSKEMSETESELNKIATDEAPAHAPEPAPETGPQPESAGTGEAPKTSAQLDLGLDGSSPGPRKPA